MTNMSILKLGLLVEHYQTEVKSNGHSLTPSDHLIKREVIYLIMDIHDYVELITLALWVISVVGIGILSRVHFKNKRLEQFRNTADSLMKSYVNLYDKENLSDEQKINRVGNAVVNSLEAKGFKLNRQEVQDIFAEVAKQMNEQTQDK